MSRIQTGQPVFQKGAKPAVSKPIRQAARDAICQLAIPGVCTGETLTVVGCHLRMFGLAGMAQKPDDLFLVDGCSNCHAALDDRSRWAALGIGYDDILLALIRSQQSRRAAGLITLEGEG